MTEEELAALRAMIAQGQGPAAEYIRRWVGMPEQFQAEVRAVQANPDPAREGRARAQQVEIPAPAVPVPTPRFELPARSEPAQPAQALPQAQPGLTILPSGAPRPAQPGQALAAQSAAPLAEDAVQRRGAIDEAYQLGGMVPNYPQPPAEAPTQGPQQLWRPLGAGRIAVLRGGQWVPFTSGNLNELHDLGAQEIDALEYLGAAPSGGGAGTRTEITTEFEHTAPVPQYMLDRAATAGAGVRQAQAGVDAQHRQAAERSAQSLSTLAGTAEQQQAEQQALMERQQAEVARRVQRLDQTMANVAAQRIDPEAFFAGPDGFARRLGAGIAVALGSLSGNPNAALGIINNMVERNVQAQQMNLQNAQQGVANQASGLAQFREILDDEEGAAAALRASALQTVVTRLDAQMASARPEQLGALQQLSAALMAARDAQAQVAGFIARAPKQRVRSTSRGPGLPTANDLFTRATDRLEARDQAARTNPTAAVPREELQVTPPAEAVPQPRRRAAAAITDPARRERVTRQAQTQFRPVRRQDVTSRLATVSAAQNIRAGRQTAQHQQATAEHQQAAAEREARSNLPPRLPTFASWERDPQGRELGAGRWLSAPVEAQNEGRAALTSLEQLNQIVNRVRTIRQRAGTHIFRDADRAQLEADQGTLRSILQQERGFGVINSPHEIQELRNQVGSLTALWNDLRDAPSGISRLFSGGANQETFDAITARVEALHVTISDRAHAILYPLGVDLHTVRGAQQRVAPSQVPSTR